MPLILFISREPNDGWGLLEGVKTYNPKWWKTGNWSIPLKAVSYIIGENHNVIKGRIESKCYSPIMLSYRYPLAIPNGISPQEKWRIRSTFNTRTHSDKLSRILNDYTIKLIIDHSGAQDKLIVNNKGNPKHIYLGTYFGDYGRIGKKLCPELDKQIQLDPGLPKLIKEEVWSTWGPYFYDNR